MNGIQGKSFLVTGAASGIGLATVDWLADHGAARLVLVDRDPARLEAVSAPVELVKHAGDVRDEALWRAVAPSLTGLDGAVVNAGIAGAAPIAGHPFERWRDIVSVNLDGAFLTLRAAMEAIGKRSGAIVLVASAAGVKAEPGIAAYAASKAAVIQLAKVAAKEGAAQGLRVNAIAPAGVETPIWDAVPFFTDLVDKTGSRDAAFAEMAKMGTPIGRYAAAPEVAAQIGFLLSDAAATITGTVLVSDGGYTL